MSRPVHRLMLLLGLTCLGGTALSCTVDEATEGKPCDLTAPREKQCIAGYSCTCEAEGCFCRANPSMSSAGLSVSPPAVLSTPSVESQSTGCDPSRRFLQRHVSGALELEPGPFNAAQPGRRQ